MPEVVSAVEALEAAAGGSRVPEFGGRGRPPEEAQLGGLAQALPLRAIL